MCRHILVTGAAGFIGSHLIDSLLADGARITGVDNLVRGRRAHLAAALAHPRFHFLEADAADSGSLRRAFEAALSRGPVDCVWHMASNSDIGAGVADPGIDLRDTYLTTFHTLRLMREFRIPRLSFASSSAVYGNHPGMLHEDSGPLFPISNYGAMKLASEALISAAVESFLKQAWIFRFPNVVGTRATHGIIYDLLHKLAKDPPDLEVLGDGTQQKPYLHVSELVGAMRFIVRHASERLNYFNIGVRDEGATVKFIAEEVLRQVAPGVPIRFIGGSSGWVGDVPRFRYCVEKLAALGWEPRLKSTDAVRRAVSEMRQEVPVSCRS